MQGKDILISIILFSVFIAGAFLSVGYSYGVYGTTYTDDTATYNKINAVTADVNSMQDKLSSSGASPVGFLEYISTGAWQSLKLVMNSGILIKGITESIGTQFGIPTIFISAFLSIAMIIIIFAILSAVFRRAA